QEVRTTRHHQTLRHPDTDCNHPVSTPSQECRVYRHICPNIVTPTFFSPKMKIQAARIVHTLCLALAPISLCPYPHLSAASVSSAILCGESSGSVSGCLLWFRTCPLPNDKIDKTLRNLSLCKPDSLALTLSPFDSSTYWLSR